MYIHALNYPTQMNFDYLIVGMTILHSDWFYNASQCFGNKIGINSNDVAEVLITYHLGFILFLTAVM